MKRLDLINHHKGRDVVPHVGVWIETRFAYPVGDAKSRPYERSLWVSNGELLLEEQIVDGDKSKTMTKLPFQKILALFIIGHIQHHYASDREVPIRLR